MTPRVKFKIAHGDGFHVKFDPEPHVYYMPEVEPPYADEQVESVTTILGDSVPPPFGVGAWYGMRIGFHAVVELALRYGWGRDGLPPNFTAEALEAWTVREKLSTNHPWRATNEAKDRGSKVHKIVENFVGGETLPDPALIPGSERGYIESFAAFLNECEPEFIRSEVLVGHPKLRYAGTLDAHARIDGEFWLLDFKTSKNISEDSMHSQLEAYDAAAQHMGYAPADHKAVVHLTPNGKFDVSKQLSESVATLDDFKVFLNAHRARKSIKERASAAKKAAKKAEALRPAA